LGDGRSQIWFAGIVVPCERTPPRFLTKPIATLLPSLAPLKLGSPRVTFSTQVLHLRTVLAWWKATHAAQARLVCAEVG